MNILKAMTKDELKKFVDSQVIKKSKNTSKKINIIKTYLEK